jgi:hypothetical protein
MVWILYFDFILAYSTRFSQLPELDLESLKSVLNL